MVTKARLTALALALPNTVAVPHMDRTAFRVPARIFATLAADASDVNLRLDASLQAAACEARPKAFTPVHGGWGRMGWTRCVLAAVDEVDLVRVLGEAHALASEPTRKKKSTRAPRAKARR
jgi:hypothetical protein